MFKKRNSSNKPMIEYLIGLLAFMRTYATVKLFLIKRKKYSNIPIMNGADPFFYKRGSIGVLMIHGFTSTPQEMKSLGKYLAKRDITCYCPLLKYHGTVVEDLTKGNLLEWNEQVINEVNFLKQYCDMIYVAGNSFGGNLTLIYASSHRIQGVISFGTPVFWKRERFYKSMYFILRQFKIFQKKSYPSNRNGVDPRIIKRKVHYSKVPLPTLSQVLKSASMTKKVLSKIQDPILIIQSVTDHMVDKRTPGYIYDRVGSKQKKIVWINDSYHVVLVDKNKKIAFEETYQFIQATKKDLNKNLTQKA